MTGTKHSVDDPIAVQAMLEIDIIAHLADLIFARQLEEGMTTAQFGVLNRLVRLRRRETVGELASAFHVSAPTMSSTVRQLERKALIRLEPSKDDRRRKFVVLTPDGETARARGVEKQVELLARVAGLVDETEWVSVQPVLNRLRLRMEEEV